MLRYCPGTVNPNPETDDKENSSGTVYIDQVNSIHPGRKRMAKKLELSQLLM